MKLALFIGNCQCGGIIHFLKKSIQFTNTYNVKQYANWEILLGKENLPINEIKNADLLIYQPLTDIHGCYSTNSNNPNSFIHLLKTDAIKISFPRIHNNSLWPIFNKTDSKTVFYGAEGIEYYHNQKFKLNDILKIYDTGNFDFKFEERFNKNINISKSKEENTDIKVVDFIIKNLSNEQLFLTHDHPTGSLFFY